MSHSQTFIPPPDPLNNCTYVTYITTKTQNFQLQNTYNSQYYNSQYSLKYATSSSRPSIFLLSHHLSPLLPFLNKLHILFQLLPGALFLHYHFLLRILFAHPRLLFPQFQFSLIFCHNTIRPIIILHERFYRNISAFSDDFLQLVFLPGKPLFALVDLILCRFLLFPFKQALDILQVFLQF